MVGPAACREITKHRSRLQGAQPKALPATQEVPSGVTQRKEVPRNTSGTVLRREVPFRSSAAAPRSALSLQPPRTGAVHHHGRQL
eukprot:scaffold50185_cov59-Phaeocystis_antarctica.AAC.3